MRGAYKVVYIAAALAVLASPLSSFALSEEFDYTFFDRMGELRLVERDKDLYIEKLDGSERKKMTSTSAVIERDAFFSKDGIYVVYETDESRYFAKGVADIKYRYFLQSVDAKEESKEDGSSKIEIDRSTYRDFKTERMRDRERAE